MSQYFGWELLFASVENAIRTKEDLMVVVFHWLMIRENYLCVGTGNEVSGTGQSKRAPLTGTIVFFFIEGHFGRGGTFGTVAHRLE